MPRPFLLGVLPYWSLFMAERGDYFKSTFDPKKSTYKYTQEDLESIKIVRPLSKKQELYLNDTENDIICWGGSAGSGKSEVSLIDLLISGYDDSAFRAMIIRKTKEVMKNAGSIYDSACDLFSQYGVKPRNTLDFTFPSGAFLKLGALEREQDKHSYQGTQCTRFLIDEAQQLPEGGVLYLNGRLRSKSKAKHQLKLTCNPEKSSYLCQWLIKGGYLNEEGLPKPEMDGKTTYMAEVAGEVVFKQSYEDFVEEYGEDFVKDLEPQKFVFYSASVYDNPWILKNQPSYVSKLKNLPSVERKKLYEGCWFADVGGGSLFKQEWVTMVEAADVPKHLRRARSWDKGATKPNPNNPDPDASVGIKGCIDEDGNLWIEDVEYLKDRPAVVQQTIEKCGEQDGKDCLISIPQDVGAAGKESAHNSKARLQRLGFNVVICNASKGKAIRFEPVSILAQERKVFVVRAPWNKRFFDELETLDFNSRKRGVHDDQADALSDLLFVLTKKMLTTTIKINPQRKIRGNTRL